MRTHYQIGQGVQLQPSPYGQGPYPCEMEDGNVDQALKEVYEANIPLIIENHREGAMHSVYNKPLTNDFEINELMCAAEDIFQRQQHAFKQTLTFGFILVHTEEKRYRFFQALRKRFGNGKSHFHFQKDRFTETAPCTK